MSTGSLVDKNQHQRVNADETFLPGHWNLNKIGHIARNPGHLVVPGGADAWSMVEVMSGGLNNNPGQHHLGQVTTTGHHVMYQNVQAVNASGSGQHHQQNQGMMVHHHGKSNKKKPKVNKDGVPAPKRATTAYINFTQWYREELKKSGRPIPKIGEFGKECAGKWNQMCEEEKQPFLEVAAKDRERYKKEMAVYKPARDANKPKRPGTAFMLFMGDFRKEMAGKEPEGGVAALAKLGGERWRGMTDEEKRPYVEKQNEEKVRYEANMEDYRRKSAESLTSGPQVKQARLSTEGSEGGEDSASTTNDNNQDHSNQSQSQDQQQQQAQNMVIRQQETPSPASSSPSPANQQQQQEQQEQQQEQNINNSSMSSMNINQAITNHALASMGYGQHSFGNFIHPGSPGVMAANYNQAHQGGLSVSNVGSSYLQSGAGGTYTQGPHYNWNQLN
ncbi:high mobility group protein DSP1 isoform X2 [Tetranychus urticae]|uniref:high mobility group protein DSP1 isoform X2 n=1 Tax=Tetranychus urticae TaxID=32264 RepID=UPI00077B85CD|nr:high mobility group protein DSP1 isoform X2 [Tetranychus urticae]